MYLATRTNSHPIEVTDADRAVARASQLFAQLMQNVPVPDEGDFFRWYERAAYDTDVLATVIRRAARKLCDEARRGFEMDSEMIGGFIAKTLKDMKRHDKPQKRTN
jgi:hypothetical protein